MIKKTVSVFLAALLCFCSFGSLCASAEEHAAAYAVSNADFAVKSAELVRADAASMLRIIGKLRNSAASFVFPFAAEAVLNENGLFVLSFESESDLFGCLDWLNANPAVLFAERDMPVFTEALEETQAHLCWGPEAIEADIYAQAITPEREVTVAVVDSGVADIDFLKNKLVDGYDFFENDDDATNDTSVDSHGTFLASIVADCTGSLPVKIMPVRVLDSKNGTLINAVNGIRYAADNGADVINFSMCAPLKNCKALEDAVAYAESENVTFVTCAGNAKTDTKNYCPSHCETVITVSALDKYNNFCADFSNYGNEVYLTAPGNGIIGYNAAGELTALNGTSMSTAFVSASAAMFLADNPYCNTKQVRAVLKSCALDIGEAGKDIYFGWGIPKLGALAESGTTYVESIGFSADSYSLEMGETLTLEPVFYPADATDKGFVLSAEGDAISVSGNVISALSAGTATVTVTSNDGAYTATAQITVNFVPPEIAIKNNTGVKVINYGETLRLTAETKNTPADCSVWWYVDGVKSGEGSTFELSPESGVVVTVKLADSSGKIITDGSGTEISDFQTVNVKSGFWQKLISFFKNLFGISRLVVQSIENV